MATTFNFELNKKANRAGKFAIMLRITQDRKSKRFNTTIQLSRISDWNPKKQMVRTSEPNYEKWNEILDAEKEQAKEKYRDLRTEGKATPTKIKDEVRNEETSSSFIQFARECTQAKYDERSIGVWRNYNKFCNKIEAFRKKKDLLFSELTVELVEKFNNYLHRQKNKKNPDQYLHPNTVASILKIFRTIIGKAVKQGKMDMDKNPFLSFPINEKKTEKARLDESEMQSIAQLDLPLNSVIDNVRNLFLFAYYCAGIRCADVLQLRWHNITDEGSRINYIMGKNHKTENLILVESAKAILRQHRQKNSKPNDYIFPFFDSKAAWAKASTTMKNRDNMNVEMKMKLFNQISAKEALVNKYLRKIATLAGIDKHISFHVSRHSFAKAAKEAGIDNLEVKLMLNHSSLQTTEKYMGNFESSKIDNAMNQIFQKSIPNDEATIINQLKAMDADKLAKVLAALGK